MSDNKSKTSSKQLVGKLVLEIHKRGSEDEWFCEVVPVMLTRNKTDYMRLALLTAAVHKYVTDSVGFINKLVENTAIDNANVTAGPFGKVVPEFGKAVPEFADNGFDDGEL